MKDREKFGNWMAKLIAAHRVDLDDFGAAAYWEALDDVPDELAARAARHALKTCERMPPPATIRRIAREFATTNCQTCGTTPCLCSGLKALESAPDPRLRDAIRETINELANTKAQ